MAEEAKATESAVSKNKNVPEDAAPNSSSSNELITSLAPKDVLLGRGLGPNEWRGNRRFRELIEQRKEEYNSTRRNDDKSRIAQEFLNDLKATETRFLQLVESGETVDDVLTDGTWAEVDDNVALEKIKQAFRQRRTKRKKANEDGWNQTQVVQQPRIGGAYNEGHFPMPTGGFLLNPPAGVFFGGAGESLLRSQTLYPSLVANILPATLLGVAEPAAADRRPLLFQRDIFGLSQQQQQVASMAPPLDHTEKKTISAERVTQVKQQDMMQHNNDDSSTRTQSATPLSADTPSALPENDMEDIAADLFSLTVADLPKISDEEEALERAAMTAEERAAALSDLYGQFCSSRSHQNKDLDRSSIDVLIREMRKELELIPAGKKQALLEAQTKCRPEEFSDARLEKFIRCQDMNTKVSVEVECCRVQHVTLCVLTVILSI